MQQETTNGAKPRKPRKQRVSTGDVPRTAPPPDPVSGPRTLSRELVSELLPPLRPRAHDPAAITELAASLLAHGQLQPLLVRPTARGLEVVDGDGRRQAMLQAGLEAADVEVRELSDEAALELALVTTLQREDLHPMEEAELLEALQRGEHRTVDALAARVGKTASYVHGRMRLLGLSPASRESFRARRLTLRGAIALARLDEKRQAAVIAHWRFDADDDPIPTSELLRDIERQMHDLSKVRFALDVVIEGVDAPPCMTCPSRSGTQTALFADGVQSDMLCGDPVCFKRKNDALWAQAKKAAKATGTKVVAKLPATNQANAWWDGRLATNAYRDLDATMPNGKTYREAAPKAIGELKPSEIIVTRDDHGVVREVVPRAVADRIADAGKKDDKPKRKLSASEQRWHDEVAQRRREAKIRTAVLKAVREALPAAILACDTPDRGLRAIIRLAADDVATPEAADGALAAAATGDLQTLVTAALWVTVGTKVHEHHYHDLDAAECDALEQLGIDVAGIRAGVVATMKAAAKAKKPAKKAPAKKAAAKAKPAKKAK